ncbi:PEGA domain-containing protein [Archangium lansingense]|uniref:PEGA domain-containing protein n=1 Tax=Archangium lansingense TaxID=2995310 RepID=A0ABT4AJV0_9BACT|nr:PEGA domain-containing protein [Archangium lansinium]MCY1081974.1 PEGA domain-containing protein [Archangium lansinium]
MNRSRFVLTLSAALLALWTAPVEAQTARGKQKTAAVRKPVKKQAGARQAGAKLSGSKRLRSKQRPGAVEKPAADAPTSEIPTASDAPLGAALQPSTEAPNLAPPPPSAPQAATMPEPTGDRPWAKGVSKEQQQAAMVLFQAANALLKESVFVQAVEKYREALQSWKHPAIHYNLALALMNLDQPVEVHEQLVEALRYGPAPLETEKYEYARNYKTLMERQLARVEISCDTPGATVTLDGQTLFVAPGNYAGLVRPGAHSIVATKEGFLPSDQSRTLLPGETAALQLKMFTSEDLIEYRRKWAAWMPWMVVGAGVAVGAGSGWLHLQARDNLRALDEGVTQCGGCFLTPALDATLNRGNTYQSLAIGGYALGGAALVTGVVLVFINQPQPFRIDPTQKKVEVVGVAPLVGSGTGGILTTFRF